MPDIFPPTKKQDKKNNKKTSKSPGDNTNTQKNPPQQNQQSNSPYSQPSPSPWNSPYGNNPPSFGRNNSFPNPNSGNKNLSPEEKTEIVKKLYKEIFDRDATTRDINYYKYSTLDEPAIRKKLIQSKEHKELIEKGKEHSDLKSRADEAEGKVRQLKAQIKDQVEEFKKLTQLLREKNRYIEQLRRQCNNPYNIVRPVKNSQNSTNNSQQQHNS